MAKMTSTSVRSAPNIGTLRTRVAQKTIRLLLPAITATTSIAALVAECKTKIRGFQLTPVVTLASDGTNYWQVGLRNETAAADIVAAASATIKNSAAALTALTTYTHDITDADVAVGDIISVVITKNASAVSWAAGALLEIFIEDQAN